MIFFQNWSPGDFRRRFGSAAGRLYGWIVGYPFPALIFLVGLAGWFAFPEKFVADDSYFYLTIARNLALHGEQTFTRIYPTNGFHPLWGYLLAGYSLPVALLGKEVWLSSELFFLPLSLSVLAGGAWLTTCFLEPDGTLVTLTLCPILAFLVASSVLFSEAHLVFFMLAATLLAGHGTRAEYPSSFVLFGLVLGGLFLARLDMIFVVLACLLWIGVRHSWSNFILSSLTCLLLIVPYLLSNYLWFGGIMPISGALKFSFPRFSLRGFQYMGGVDLSLSGVNVPFGLMAVEVAGLGGLVGRFNDEKKRTLFFSLVLGVIGQLLYIILFGQKHTQRYWYYVPSVYLGSLGAAFVARRFSRSRIDRVPFYALLVVATIAAVGIQLMGDQPTKAQVTPASFIQSRAEPGRSVVLSDWPGYAAFVTRVPIVPTDLLTANRNVYRTMTQSENSLKYLVRKSREAGKPIGWIVHVGSGNLRTIRNQGTLVHLDPGGSREPIGKLEVGPPDTSIKSRSLRAWRMNE